MDWGNRRCAAAPSSSAHLDWLARLESGVAKNGKIVNIEEIVTYVTRKRFMQSLSNAVRHGILVLGLTLLAPGAAIGEGPVDSATCLENLDLTRIARVVAPNGQTVYARVTQHTDGHIDRAATIAPANTPLATVFERAAAADAERDFAVTDDRVCAVVDLPEADLDEERRVLISTGLNYAAHAEEAGGGDVFLFPKPSAPTAPYAPVHPPAHVRLLDYEVELAYVLLEDIDPFAPPSREALYERTAFFLSNDLSDREPIVEQKAVVGPGTGFVEGKGQPGFMPAGPWMVRGSELFAALEVCGGEGLGLELWVDEESEPRQRATTERMILQPEALIARIGSWIETQGRRTDMPFRRPGDAAPRFYPFAIPEEAPRLPAGSIIQTGTPEGIALQVDSILGVAMRGLLRLRSPQAQLVIEQKERLAAGGSRYLVPGSVVRARIDGLGEQRFAIAAAGTVPPRHPCDGDE
jgi:2-keto-4-pentenoate hydratase/2-oxohepta-3-ene-1,7-dioic acid hydratase in catechol pathway